jgi:hypothetical protein
VSVTVLAVPTFLSPNAAVPPASVTSSVPTLPPTERAADGRREAAVVDLVGGREAANHRLGGDARRHRRHRRRERVVRRVRAVQRQADTVTGLFAPTAFVPNAAVPPVSVTTSVPTNPPS